MRIAYVTETYPPEVNGVSLSVSRVVRALRERGHQVDLVRPARATEEPGAAAGDELLVRGCPLMLYPDLRFGLALPATLSRLFRQRGTELVHVATPGPLSWAALLAARSAGLASTADYRTRFDQYSAHYRLGLLAPLVRRGLKRFHHLAQRNFVPTDALRRELQCAGFENVSVVGRGVDTRLFSPEHRDEGLRRQWRDGRSETGPVLLHVGRLAAEKNVELALRSFETARLRWPATRMVVVGDGPQRRQLEQRHPHAHFVGPLRGEALAAHYASADVFLFPSLTETFGNVVLEAMASGLAIIAFDCAAAAQHLRHRSSAILVPPGRASSFSWACVALLACGWDMAALRLRAREAALALSWERVAAHLEAELMLAVRGRQAALHPVEQPRYAP